MARIGGAFPFPLAQVQEGGSRVELASGGVFYPPPGEYIFSLDAATILQYFDGQAQSWQTLYPASTGGYLSADGYNYRFLNTTGILTSLSLTAGSGMTNGIGSVASGVSASIAASDTTGGVRATVSAIIGGSVAAPTITQGGSGFLEPPLIVIDPPPQGGIQATATCALTAAGVITSVTMANVGAGYAASPNFWVIPQPATYQGGPAGGGAIAAGAIPAPGLVFPGNAVPGNQNTSSAGAQLTSIALTGSGTLTGLVITNPGGGYTSANPAVTFTGGAGGVASTATVATTSPAVSLVRLQPRVQ
jgi:hypothetical protein